MDINIRLSDAFDRMLFRRFQSFLVDGYEDAKSLVEKYVQAGFCVVDVGGGKRPFFSVSRKSELSLNVIGLDISAVELMNAPQGAYDEILCSAVEDFQEALEADLVICIAVLEHVRSSSKAVASISRMLKPGGRAIVFVPSRNALFARLNLILPERLKKKLLYFAFPETVSTSGFKSYYDECTPQQMRDNVENSGCIVEKELLYFSSGYFRLFFPLHVFFRAWLVIFRLFKGKQAAETFAFIIKKI